MADGGKSVAVGASSTSNRNQKLNKNMARATRDKQRQIQINRMIDNADWMDLTNFIVEDNVLKIILGMDSSLFSMDMLHKIMGNWVSLLVSSTKLFA